jgi:hypothetical protein
VHLEDNQISDSSWGGGVRPCAPCPAVWVLMDDPHAEVDRQWQYYLRAINYNMALEDVYLLLDYRLAFANRTGFRNPSSPRADYFHNRDLQYKPPQLDKVRTCSRNVLTGATGYSLMVALRETVTAVTTRQPVSLRTALTASNVLEVRTLDSVPPPPLRAGRSYPARMEDVNPDDYAFLPRTHPWLFVTATIVNARGECVQFPRGRLYSWTEDRTPRSFLPLVSHHGYGPVRYPLSRLRRLADSEPVPSPYRHL